ncbi:MAG: phenylalanine--tRNA ligase subunit alpha, partial [Cyanobacteriota bacterium]
MSAPISLQQLTDQLAALEAEAAGAIAVAGSAAELEDLRVGLLGKKGKLSAVLGA